MGASNSDALTQVHQLGENLGARDDRKSAIAGRHHFRVVRAHGGRIHHDLHVADVVRVMALRNAGAERCEPIGYVRALHVRSAHLVPEVHQKLRDPAHSDPANADEMDPPRLLKHTHR